MQAARVFLRGGLGNQFFEWLHALSLSERKQLVVLDTSFLRQVRKNQAAGRLELAEIFTDLQLALRHMPELWRIEPAFTRLARICGYLQTDAPIATPGRGFLHYGYYQHPRHFSTTAVKTARALLKPALRVADTTLGRYAAIHIRGGDYATSRYNREQIGLIAPEYYKRVFQKLSAQHPDLTWLIVSDDYRHARKLTDKTRSGGRVVYLDQHLGRPETAQDALMAMLNAKVLCCANSSFSAMAGYLGDASHIYAPMPWFRGTELAHANPTQNTWHRVSAAFMGEP